MMIVTCIRYYCGLNTNIQTMLLSMDNAHSKCRVLYMPGLPAFVKKIITVFQSFLDTRNFPNDKCN